MTTRKQNLERRQGHQLALEKKAFGYIVRTPDGNEFRGPKPTLKSSPCECPSGFINEIQATGFDEHELCECGMTGDWVRALSRVRWGHTMGIVPFLNGKYTGCTTCAKNQDEVAVQSYIRDKMAPFDDYKFADQDEEAIKAYVREKLQ